VTTDAHGLSETGPIWFFTTGDKIADKNPIANAGGPYQGSINENILFDGSQSTDDQQITGYRWDFTSDGNWDTPWQTSQTINHQYPQVFTGSVTLQVTDEDDNLDTDTAQVTITTGSNPPSTPTIEGLSSAKTNTSYQINVTATDNEDETLTLTIDWGDDTAEETQIASSGITKVITHTYTKTGFFTIAVTAKDSENSISPEATKLVIVSEGTISNNNNNEEQEEGFPWIYILLIIIIIAVAIILILNRKQILTKETIITILNKSPFQTDKHQTYELPDNQVQDFNTIAENLDTDLNETEDKIDISEDILQPVGAAGIKEIDTTDEFDEDNEKDEEDDSTTFKRI